MLGVRRTLRLGATVFGLSAILLMIAPGTFLSLLAITGSPESEWSMRMIGITLIALAGNMWVNSENPESHRVRQVGVIMCIAATGLGVLTLLIPAEINWFSAGYAAVGFAFGLNYLACLIRRKF